MREAKMDATKRNIGVTLECFVKKEGKYLMLHRGGHKRIMPNVWMAPGGHREFNEGVFECARREIKEETGLEIKNLRIIATGNAYLKDLNQELFFHFVEAEYESGEVISNPEDGELVWIEPAQIPKLENILSEIKKVWPYLFGDEQKLISYKAVYEKGNEMSYFKIEE
jgi:8-oxo-dGTP diphosphatase